jgi:flagella basal body P-ring formation protein FlgA
MMRVLLLCVVLASCGSAEELRITLRENAEVAAPQAVLADVAEVRGDFAVVNALSSVVVQQLPDLAVYDIDDQAIRRALAKIIDVRNLDIPGKCRLQREAQTFAEDDIVGAARQQVLATIAGDVEVTVARKPVPILVPADEEAETTLKAEPLTNSISGEMPYRIRVMRNDRELGRGLVVLTVRTFRTVAVAARTMRSGTLLGLGDVRLDRVDINAASATAVTKLEDVVGMTLINHVKEGEPLTGRLINQAPAVLGGKPVTLVYERDNFFLTAPGTALSNGAIGDVINVRRESDGRNVQAKVMEEGRLLVNFQ